MLFLWKNQECFSQIWSRIIWCLTQIWELLCNVWWVFCEQVVINREIGSRSSNCHPEKQWLYSCCFSGLANVSHSNDWQNVQTLASNSMQNAKWTTTKCLTSCKKFSWKLTINITAYDRNPTEYILKFNLNYIWDLDTIRLCFVWNENYPIQEICNKETLGGTSDSVIQVGIQ